MGVSKTTATVSGHGRYAGRIDDLFADKALIRYSKA